MITGSGEERGSLRDLVIQPDGKIVATGDAVGVALQSDGKIKDTRSFQVVRYLTDGKLDEGFGTGGRASADFGEQLQVANSVALQADGKIVLAGAAGNLAGGGFDFALARFSRDGTLDQDFGNGGLVTTDLGSEGDSAVGLVIQPDRRIVAAGSTLPPPGAEDETTSSSNALVRYLP